MANADSLDFTCVPNEEATLSECALYVCVY